MTARAPYVDPRAANTDDIRRLVATAPHELSANLNFNDYGLRSWLAADRVIKDHDGALTVERVALDALDGDYADLTLYYQDSGILPPESGRTPAGTPVRHESIREFRIQVDACDDVGERKANYHIRPRWADMVAEDDDGRRKEVPVPDTLANTDTDAVSVSVAGANIEFGRYLPLLREAARHLGLARQGSPFGDTHPTSNIQDAERYVRVDRDLSGPVHARDGPLVRLAHVLENDREGYRKLVQNDTDARGRNLPGYYHTVTLGPERIREVFGSHKLPKEVKHYYAREARDRAPSDSLAHPKVGASYQVNRWDDTLYWDELDRLSRELDETIYSVLAEAGLDLRAGGETYVPDAYFEAENATTDANIVSLDVAKIRQEQEHIVVRHLADGLSPVEQDALSTLVTDGGEVAPADIAAANDRHIDSVYRALDRMEDLIEQEYGSVSLRSTYVAELVHSAIDEARDAAERAVDATSRALDAADRGLDERTSAFVAWASTHDINFREDDSVSVDLGRVDSRDEARRLLREGYELWQDMDRDEVAFRTGTYRYAVERRVNNLNSVGGDETETRRHSNQIWRGLKFTE